MIEHVATHVICLLLLLANGFCAHEQASMMRSFRPNEANAIDYRRSEGHFLGANCDDRQMSGEVLCNLCLAGDAVMTYVRDRPKVQGRPSAPI